MNPPDKTAKPEFTGTLAVESTPHRREVWLGGAPVIGWMRSRGGLLHTRIPAARPPTTASVIREVDEQDVGGANIGTLTRLQHPHPGEGGSGSSHPGAVTARPDSVEAKHAAV